APARVLWASALRARGHVTRLRNAGAGRTALRKCQGALAAPGCPPPCRSHRSPRHRTRNTFARPHLCGRLRPTYRTNTETRDANRPATALLQPSVRAQNAIRAAAWLAAWPRVPLAIQAA